jgi:hypothetical protein
MSGEYGGWNGSRDFLGEGGAGKGGGIARDFPQRPLYSLPKVFSVSPHPDPLPPLGLGANLSLVFIINSYGCHSERSEESQKLSAH